MSGLKRKGLSGVKLLLAAFFIVAVLLPLICMLTTMAGEDVGGLITSEGFMTALRHSVWVSFVSTLISVGLAVVLAWFIQRSAIRCKGLFTILFTLPMLIPSISHGMGPVSYTHLDVYKRQVLMGSLALMWKGMLSIFVVIAAICIIVMIMNKVTRKKKQKEE